MKEIRNAGPSDLKALTELERLCFPEAEAASEEKIQERLFCFPDHFWLLTDTENPDQILSFVNGMVTDLPDLTDEMYENADMHREKGSWLMLFGVGTRPAFRGQGLAGMLLRRVIDDTKARQQKGIVLTCKKEKISFYQRFGFQNEGVSRSLHGGETWYQMRLSFEKKAGRAGIVCCSNGLFPDQKDTLDRLGAYLETTGLTPVFSPCLYQKNSLFSGTARQRAECLMEFYRDPSVSVIFDVSGGDLANEILPFLDYEKIARSTKEFWGYSDLTTVLNAIYTKTGKTSVLYQVKHLVSEEGRVRQAAFENTVRKGGCDLFRISCQFLRGDGMEGIVTGGNIRCLLKLAGTEYWPDMSGKILLLESLGGDVGKMVTYLSQLQQLHVFEKVNGILLGTFTEMEKHRLSPTMEELVLERTKGRIPVASTREIGHGKDAAALRIGEKAVFVRKTKELKSCAGGA